MEATCGCYIFFIYSSFINSYYKFYDSFYMSYQEARITGGAQLAFNPVYKLKVANTKIKLKILI